MKQANILDYYIMKNRIICRDFLVLQKVRIDLCLARIRIIKNYIVLVHNQIDALFQYIYLFHFSTCFQQPNAHHQENRIVSIHHLVYVTLCR